jgi:hypothetical protein
LCLSRKSSTAGIAIGGGALGTGVGALAGGVGGIAGGVGGYAAGDALANWLLGDDDKKKVEPKKEANPQKSVLDSQKAQPIVPPIIPDVPDIDTKPTEQTDEAARAQMLILAELRKNNEELLEMRRIMTMKLEQANRLLAKIEVSAQSIS